MIVGQEKPSLQEVLEHHGVRGMKWGVRKENQTSLANIGDRLNKKKVPLLRSLLRNQGAGTAVNLGTAGLAAALTAATGGAAGALFVPTVAVTSAIMAGSSFSANMMSIRDIAAISASDLRKHNKGTSKNR